MAVLIQALAMHGILSLYDVRAEPILTALCTGAIYYFYRSYATGRWWYLLLTAVLAGCAVMTKGIFILLTIGGGMVVYWAITKQWKQFKYYKWYLLLLLIFICTLPELYSLYTQFDQHPEKTVFGKTGVSGLRFFFWDSQFGRFFNTGPIKGKGDPSFFLHTTLWAFLPWALYLYIAVFLLVRRRMRLMNTAQWIVYGGAGLTFLLFSLSSFQLPHYIIILFPEFSMITADYLSRVTSSATWKRLLITQNVLLVIAAVLVTALMLFSKIGYSVWVFVITAVVLVAAFSIGRGHVPVSFFVRGIGFAAVLFLFLNCFFYPRLMQYQSGMMASKWLARQRNDQKVGMYDQFDYTLDFYTPGSVAYLHTSAALKTFVAGRGRLVYTKKALLPEVQALDSSVVMLQSFPYFHITKLKGKFINPATRPQVVDTMVLLQVNN
jgi:4-amino-4-deoxy-L-arabinose transferase-like glycosyltransferase